MNKLTPKQKTFCQEYLVDLNATQAAIRAGYSKKSAGVVANEILMKPYIQAEIQKLMEKRSERIQVKADDVVKELALMAFSRLNNYLSWDGSGISMKDSDDLTDDQIACVVEIQETLTDKSSNLKFKLGDKLKSLELLGRHLGMFAEPEKGIGDININVAFGFGEDNLQGDSTNRIKQFKVNP